MVSFIIYSIKESRIFTIVCVLCVASGHLFYLTLFFVFAGHWYLEFHVNITQAFMRRKYCIHFFPAVVNHNLLATVLYLYSRNYNCFSIVNYSPDSNELKANFEQTTISRKNKIGYSRSLKTVLLMMFFLVCCCYI